MRILAIVSMMLLSISAARADGITALYLVLNGVPPTLVANFPNTPACNNAALAAKSQAVVSPSPNTNLVVLVCVPTN
jgi:hypothetical protein